LSPEQIEKYNEIRYACKDILDADTKYDILDKEAVKSIGRIMADNEWSHQSERLEQMTRKCDELFTENQSLTRKLKRLEKKLSN